MNIDREDIDQQEIHKLLAKRFRAERLRLNLTTADIAHYCGVSVSSVFAWEASRSRIPLSVAASLWKYGFDTESVIEGTEKQYPISLLSEGMEFEESQEDCFVPTHMLARYKCTKTSGFVYHNHAFAKDIGALGDLILMRIIDNQTVVELDKETTVLFRPSNSGSNEFICSIKTAGKGRLHIHAGGNASTIRSKLMLDNGEAVGMFCYRVGYKQVDGSANKTHPQRLDAYLKRIGA